jgi:hypothetical protein
MALSNNHIHLRGFNEVTNANGVYFQLWNGKTPTVNTGANGLGALGIGELV